MMICQNNVRIYDGALTPKKDFDGIIDFVRKEHPECKVFRRTNYSLKMEWAVHCFLYRIGYKVERTRNVDLNIPTDKPEWLYIILGSLIWIFVK